MASSFLKRKAEEQAKKIDKEYGAAAYGGSSTLAQETVNNGGGNGAPVTRASNFLKQKAQKQAESIDKEYGSSAYGSSDWTAFDKEAGFNAWMDNLNSLSERVSDDYTRRDGTYQSTDSFKKYLDDTDTSIDVLSGRADIYQNYFSNNRDLYGEDAVNQILSSLDEGSKYLSDVRGNLNKESDYWAQFENEDAYNEYQDVLSWQGLPSSADFEEKSQYDAEANASEKKMNILGTLLSGETGGIVYDDPGYKDLLLAYINGDKEAGAIIKNNDANMYSAGSGALGSLWAYATEGDQESQQMTDDEVKLFNYLYNTKGQDAAYKYYSYLQSDLYKRNREADEAQWSEYAKENPVGSSIFSTIMSPAKGLSYLSQAADYIGTGEIDQNAPSNKFSYIPTTIRNEVSDTIENSGKWGDVGSFSYQIGMSMADFLLNTAIGGGNQALVLGIMGSGVAADKTISAKDRGLSDGQSFALGTIAGAAEIVTEKFSLDALLNKGSKSALRYFLENAFTEGSEEVGSDLINLIADIKISKDDSEWRQSIKGYMEQGYSEAEATGLAFGDQAETMGLDFLGGAISGGVVSGGAIGINEVGNAYNAGKTGAEFNAMGDDVIQATIETGLESDPFTESYKLAAQLQQKLNNGETVSNYELGRLYQANVRTVDAEQSGEELLRQAAEQVTQGTSITNRTASDILGNTRAVGILTEDAGLTLTDNMTKSQRRAAVKSAVEALASRSGAVSEPASEITQETEAPAQTTQESAPVASRPVAQQAYDIKRVQRAASALGENGAKALTAAYNGSVDAQDYYAGFSSYYEAGVSGMDMDKVQSEYSDKLNQAQRFAAYSSGQQDAAASLTAEREGTNFVTVYGDEAGLVRNDYVAKLPKETAALYNRVARAVGVKIELVDSVRGGTANGVFLQGKNTIQLAMDADNALDVVAAHEITHRLQQLAPEAYRKYRDYVMNYRTGQNQGGSASIVEAYRSNAADAGVNLNTEKAMDEIAADFTQELIENKDLFGELAKKDRSIAGKLLDAIKEFISKVKSAFRGNAAAQDQAARSEYGVDMKTLEEAARLWTEAYNAAEAQTKATVSGTVVGTEGGYAEVDGKFSLKGVVEDNGDLLALHNMTENNLRGALELGGLPAPSIAIVQARAGHAKYGPISLVFSKDTIDPRARTTNRVYGGDAYTPTAPRVDRVLDRDVVRRVSKNIYDLAQKTADGLFAGEASAVLNFDDSYTSKTADDILDDLTRNNGVRAAYLAAQGKTLEPVVKEKANQYDTFGNDALQSLEKSVGEQELSAMAVRVETGEGLTDADVDAVRSAIRGALEQRPGGFSSTPEQRERRIELRLGKLTAERMEEFVRNAQWLHEDGMPSAEQEVDRYATMDALRDAAPDDAVRDWVRPQLDGLLGEPGIYNGKDPFTPSGNRKGFSALHNAYTLENIVKAMTSQQSERGEAVWGVSAKSLQATATPSYKSIKEIKADSGRLGAVEGEEYEARVKAVDQKISDIISRAKETNKAHSDNPFTESDIIGSVLLDAAKGRKTVDAIMRAFSTEGYNISSQTAQDIQAVFKAAAELPTEYFEAKPRRAVGFDEVLAAVVPDDMDDGLRKDTEKAGMRVLEYKSGDDADRLAKVNSVAGARFSLKINEDTAKWTNERIDRLYDKYAASSPNYSKAYATYISPDDFISLTTTRPDRIEAESTALDLGRLRDETQEIFLIYDPDEPGEVSGHEGRHRMVALRNAGVKQVPVVVQFRGEMGKQNRQPLQSLPLRGEEFAHGRAPGSAILKDLVPISQAYRADIEARFGQNGANGPSFSLKGTGSIQREMAALSEENDLLRDRVDYWKGQTKRTQRVTTDKKAVTQAARDLIRSYGADLETSEIAGDLQSLYDYISSGYDGKDELTYADARRRAEKIARTLVDNAVAVDDDQYRQYSDLRSYLRSTKLTLSKADSSNIADYNDFRKRNFGRLNLGGGSTNVDQVYLELSEMWPEFFDEQRESHPADQLLHISEVLDSIYDVTEYNPFSRFMDQATTGAANEIMEKFFELPQTRETFADRQARKLDEAKAKGRQQVQQVREQKDARMKELRKQNQQRVQNAIEKERVRREEQLDKLKTRYREKDAAGRERRSARELRAKIARHANALSQKLLRPSDKQHIPEKLRQATAAVLDAINRESAFAVDPDTGKRVKDGSGTPTKRTEAFRNLRLAYADITKDGGDYTLIIDPDLMDNLNELEDMRDTPLAEMGTQQLSTVWATLKAVEASIRTANTMLGASRFETISQFADGIKNDNILRGERGDFKSVLGVMDKLVNLDMLTPQAYFHRMGSTGEELFRMLRTAQDRHISIMRDAQQATEKIVGKADINKLERETHTFDIGGEKLTMSTAQIMSLYELMKRKQAQEHILVGGIRPDAINTRRSLRENRRSAPVRIGIDGFATITGVLTDEQIKMADSLQKYMGGALAEVGNEASMEVYGYRKFNEPDYFPIQVDKNQTKKDIAKEAQAATIAGRGFTKSVAPKANNAVMVNSIFDVYASHVNDMATYAAWLPTMENVRRIRDFTFRDGEGNRTGTVKEIIMRIFGKNGNPYLDQLVNDINQGIRPNGTGNLTDGIVGNYKAAAVAANIRVILQQPTAILRALDTLDPKYLLQGTVKRGDWEKVMKYAPIARWKDWGYFDINTGRQMKDVLLNSDTMLERVRQAGMAMAGKADSFAWARLWNAVEAETKDTRPGLKPGTDEFYKAVAARFSEIVDRTQVVDGLLQRSQIMRNPDGLNKIATSFMAEPTKTYNMFANAIYDVRHAGGKEVRSRAKKALARTTAALVTSFAVNAIMQSIVDAVRDDDKEKDYWEKMLQAYTGFSGDEETFLDYWNSFWSGNLESNLNPLAYLPYAKDLLSIAQGYDVTRMDMEAIEKAWTAGTNMWKALNGEGKYTLAGASANLMAEAARMLGLPVANLKRDVQAAATTSAIETDNYLMQYRIDSALLNMGYSGNSGNFMDILYNASINDPEAYEIIYADMVKNGVEEDKIRTAMESRMKRDQGVESVKDLETRYLTPSQGKSYSSLRGKISGTTVWTAASEEQRETLEGDLYDLTVGNTAGEALREKIDSGSAYGISEADYLLYRLAQDVASEDGNNNTSQDEAEAAIEMLSGLSDEARAYLWQSTNKGWKESGNPFK